MIDNKNFMRFQSNRLVPFKKECTSHLSNTKRTKRPKKKTKADDDRIIYTVNKHNCATASQVKNTLEQAGVSLSRLTMKRRLLEWKHSGMQTTGCTQEQEDQFRF